MSIVILCYDITSRASFENLEKWINDIEKHIYDSIIVLSGNKLDLEEKREVSYEEGLQFANEYGFRFYETSAKNDYNVNCIFEDAVKEYSQSYHMNYEQQKTVRLTTDQNADNNS